MIGAAKRSRADASPPAKSIAVKGLLGGSASVSVLTEERLITECQLEHFH